MSIIHRPINSNVTYVAEGDASPNDDAAHLDCTTAKHGKPRPPDVATLPRAQRAARLHATLPLTKAATVPGVSMTRIPANLVLAEGHNPAKPSNVSKKIM